MPRLIIQEGEVESREIELRPGVNRMGRNPESDHCIPHASVSGLHCEILVEGGGMMLRDLGSTNGTFIDGTPVQEAELKPGQRLRLGSIEMICSTDGTADGVAGEKSARPRIRIAGVSAPVRAPALEPAGMEEPPDFIPVGLDDCVNHGAVRAKFICRQCETRFCASCVKAHQVGPRSFYSCPQCDASCITMEEHRKAEARQRQTFFNSIPGAFTYAARGKGLILLIGGTLLFTVLDWFLAILGVGIGYARGLGGLIILVFMILVVMTAVGYTFAYMQAIITSSVMGEEEMPEWPEISSFWESLVIPFFRYVAIWAACLLPAVLAFAYLHWSAGMVLMALGLACIPMALLTVAVADSLAGLNPLIILSSIAKVPGSYAVTLLMFLLVLGVVGGLERVIDLIPITALPTAVQNFVALYGLAVVMRVLGLLYYTQQEKFAWFK